MSAKQIQIKIKNLGARIKKAQAEVTKHKDARKKLQGELTKAREAEAAKKAKGGGKKKKKKKKAAASPVPAAPSASS